MFHRLPPPVLAGSRRLVPYSQRSGPEPGPPALVTLRVFRSYSFPLNRFRRAPAARCCRSSLSVFNSSSVLPIIACLSAFPTGSQPVQRDHMFVTFTYTCYMLTRIHPPRYNSRLRPLPAASAPPRRLLAAQWCPSLVSHILCLRFSVSHFRSPCCPFWYTFRFRSLTATGALTVYLL